MHIPDGVLKPEVWVPLGAAGATAVAVAARAAKKRLADESIPLVGVMGAFVFALQMLNFPVMGASSDHIVGAGLLAVVFGPSIAVLCMAAIVTIQALLFGDGGIAALGANVVDMAVLSVIVAWATHRVLSPKMPTASVVVATLAGVLAGALGASVWVMMSLPYGWKFIGIMVVTHAASGAVEAMVTVAVVKYLRSVNLVRGAQEKVACA